MSQSKYKQSLENLGNALQRLEEASNLVIEGDNSVIIDGTIQRFEFCLELFWKTLKRLLEQEGIETKSPRETLKEAFQMDWLHDETAWLQMIRDRNQTSHTYDEDAAVEIYNHIKSYLPEMKKVYGELSEKYL